MKLLRPRSLMGQMLLAVAVALLLVQGVSAVLIYRAQRDRRFVPLAVVTVFFAVNIIISTMFLRWHYAIDVAAGLALAVTVRLAGPWLAAWEGRYRNRQGYPGAWEI